MADGASQLFIPFHTPETADQLIYRSSADGLPIIYRSFPVRDPLYIYLNADIAVGLFSTMYDRV